MKLDSRLTSTVLLVISLGLSALGPVMAGPPPPATPGSHIPLEPPGQALQVVEQERVTIGPEGMLIKEPAAHLEQLQPADSGGPDDFGYTWDDSVAFSWVDARGGTNTGLTGQYQQTGPIALPFSFKYYENTYDQVYVSTHGTLGFSGGLTQDSQEYVFPKPSLPNNVIAPYWAPEDASTGGVYYANGGATPNRWWVVEWYQVRDYDPGSRLTFQVVLFENGDIEFRYQTINYGGGSRWSYGVGIEDSAGLDGLEYAGYPNDGLAVRFTRPPTSARVSLSPKNAGAFSTPGAVTQFSQTIRNVGELGTDTFDLFPADLFPASNWPVTLYQQDGVTPLTDSDGDGALDTGPIAQGSSQTIMVEVAAPVTATMGQSNRSQLTARSSVDTGKSKTATLQVAVPTLFAQSYTQDYTPHASFYRPTGQTTRQTTPDSGYDAAVTTTPDGDIVQVWQQYHTNSNDTYVSELYYAVLDGRGNVVRPAARLTNNDAATLNTYDNSPAVAVAPNGNVAIFWYRYLWNSNNYAYNYNIYYLILNSAGGLVVPVTNLTNNTQWGTWDTPNVPRFYDQTIAATADNRFVMAWQRSIDDGNNRLSTIWYTVRDTSGSVVKPPTQFSGDTCSYGPNLTLLADGSVFLAQSACGWISIGRLDSAGNVLTGLTTFTTDDGNYAPDAVQLPNGNIVLAWRHWSGDKYVIQYAVLNSSLGAVKSAAEELPSLSAVGDDYVSVTFAGDQAVLTWGDACCGYQPNLYYVLLDASGNAVTLPMIFASDYTNYNLRLPYNGQGNTFLPTDTVPPTSQASSPEYALGPFLVTWSGSDADSGIVSYDVQVRDGASGTWTGWLAGTTDTSATYTDGVAGHTYYFRSVAHDAMGNVESDLPADGDAHTTVAAYQLEGQVTNNRAEPVFNATVVAQPAALNIATSAGNGSYTLYLGSAGAYTLTASRYGFGQLPPLYGVEVSTHLSGVDFVLPPLDEGVTNGGWESGNLNGWYSGSGMMPMVEMDAAHTGHYGLQLGTSGGTGSLGFWPFVIQTVSVPGTWSRPTLSFMYRVTQGDVSDKFLLRVSGDSNVITPSVTLIPGEWTHTWYDLSAFSGQTVTLDLGFQDQTGVQQIYLDEISLGKAGAGVFPVYLPLVVRSD